MASRVPGPSKSMSEGELNELLHPVSPSKEAGGYGTGGEDKLKLKSTGASIGQPHAGTENNPGGKSALGS